MTFAGATGQRDLYRSQAWRKLRASRLGMTQDWVTDGLTGHKGYIRLKTAALLALLDGAVLAKYCAMRREGRTV